MDIMCDINPDYRQHIRFKYGMKTLYLLIIKEIYGMIESALLWYELYVSVLKYMGFQLNPYDMCVSNKDINGKQFTIYWYVEDNKVSHVKQDVIDDVIRKVEERLLGLAFTKGNMHTFLGMKIRYPENRRI